MALLYVGVSLRYANQAAFRKRTVKVRAMRFDPKENWSRIQNPNPTTFKEPKAKAKIRIFFGIFFFSVTFTCARAYFLYLEFSW